jgi:endonuclease YncB( thermonuclease family)
MDDIELAGATKSCPRFSIAGDYTAKCVDVYDGDTCQCVIRIAGKLARFTCRLEGINSAEMRGAADEKVVAIAARDALRSAILSKIITLHVSGFDKYGRLLVKITVPDINDVGQWMIRGGHAAPYNGAGIKKY